MLAAAGIRTTGIDPTARLIDEARRRDPDGDYRIGRAEALAFPDAAFDLVVSYLSLIDIPDIGSAIAEMARVLKPGGSLLIANLTSFNTAGQTRGWTRALGARFAIDHYLEERADWVAWRGIRIRNWHRPLSTYMALLLDQGLVLRHFAEPEPYAGNPAAIARYRRAPWFLIMEWRKPGRVMPFRPGTPGRRGPENGPSRLPAARARCQPGRPGSGSGRSGSSCTACPPASYR